MREGKRKRLQKKDMKRQQKAIDRFEELYGVFFKNIKLNLGNHISALKMEQTDLSQYNITTKDLVKVAKTFVNFEEREFFVRFSHQDKRSQKKAVKELRGKLVLKFNTDFFRRDGSQFALLNYSADQKIMLLRVFAENEINSKLPQKNDKKEVKKTYSELSYLKEKKRLVGLANYYVKEATENGSKGFYNITNKLWYYTTKENEIILPIVISGVAALIKEDLNNDAEACRNGEPFGKARFSNGEFANSLKDFLVHKKVELPPKSVYEIKSLADYTYNKFINKEITVWDNSNGVMSTCSGGETVAETFINFLSGYGVLTNDDLLKADRFVDIAASLAKKPEMITNYTNATKNITKTLKDDKMQTLSKAILDSIKSDKSDAVENPVMDNSSEKGNYVLGDSVEMIKRLRDMKKEYDRSKR